MLRAASLALAVLGILPLANLIAEGREVPWWRLGVLIWCAYGALLVALLWVASDRWGDAFDRAAARAAAWLMRVPSPWFAASVGVLTALLGVGVALYCYAGRGFTGDEMAMTWHARMLLAGHLAIPSATHSEFFNTFSVMDRGGRWYSQYPIGGPALLALGLLVRAVWLVNPLLLGVAAWQLYRFTRLAFDEPTARAAAVLFMFTPFVLVLGATQMNHTAALTFTLVALAELAAWDAEAPRRRMVHAAGVGLAVGAVALVRPLDAALVALPIGLFQLARLRRHPERWPSVLVQCIVGAVPIALLLWVNTRTTGSALLFAYDATNGPQHALGFHLDPNGEMHSPLRGLVYVSGYLLRFDRFLFEWPLPGLLVVCAVLGMLRRATRWDALLLGLVGAFLVGYGAYWHNGFFDGPRFLFPIAPVLVLYAARAPEAAERIRHDRWRRIARLLVPACVLCAWLVPVAFSSVPGRITALRTQRTKLKTDVGAQVSAAGLTNALVFVREPWRARLMARLRALGVLQFDAEQVLNATDACALQIALDAADASTSTDLAVRRDRVLAQARAAGVATTPPGANGESKLARAPGGPVTPRCRDEAAADTLETMPYAMFLREQRVDAAGRLSGPVVYARDLGPRDTLLRREFGDRRWFLYVPGRSQDDAVTFLPLR